MTTRLIMCHEYGNSVAEARMSLPQKVATGRSEERWLYLQAS